MMYNSWQVHYCAAGAQYRLQTIHFGIFNDINDYVGNCTKNI